MAYPDLGEDSDREDHHLGFGRLGNAMLEPWGPFRRYPTHVSVVSTPCTNLPSGVAATEGEGEAGGEEKEKAKE